MHPQLAYVCKIPACICVFVANFVPAHLTLTANKGETVHLSMQLLREEKRDVTWKYNGEPN